MPEKTYKPATLVVHQGTDRDPYTGAATVPIYQASTYHHPGGQQGDYEYARGSNPSRSQVEEAIALLEGGCAGFAYASGMTAIAAGLALLKPGDHLIAPRDIYGGTWRYLQKILPEQEISTSFVDMRDQEAIRAGITAKTRALFLETPSNPQFNVTDIRAAADLAREHGLLTLLDNTFMTPLRQRPLDLGVDIVVHSATKFLGGHSDLLAGLATTADQEIARRLKLHQAAQGAVLGPFDSFLLARGLKTLKVRLDAAENNARQLAERLQTHPAVKRVVFPGLADFPQADLHFSQASGPGAVLSFELDDRDRVNQLLQKIELPIIAPSLGGVETILTHCWSMSHAAIPASVKQELGIGPNLLRLSVGLEDPDDLWQDLEAALAK
ncbi:MAG TPA: PLP-dependent aspartate aminotransferase family protein [Desulfuromonadales bacterium]|nr:PLP-dependent aspartate aminotransferase family protein [Desulfuromonadales bacterium]